MDILTIGNAIVDTLACVSEDFLTRHHLTKGSMQLVNHEEMDALYHDISNDVKQCSGGSAANTAAAIAQLGGSVGYIGKVGQDPLGGFFKNDLAKAQVVFDRLPTSDDKPTASCLVCVSDDGQRTMNTYLGACSTLTKADIDERTVAHAYITYIEGYLWDSEASKEAIRRVISIAKKHGRKIAFTLSDSFCVERHREEFLALLADVDILFGNEDEIRALFQTANLEGTPTALKEKGVKIVNITRGEHGVLILADGNEYHVPAEKVENVVDTTGAGDLYAAGFLYGFTQKKSMEECGQLGNECAAKVIQQMGARM